MNELGTLHDVMVCLLDFLAIISESESNWVPCNPALCLNEAKLTK